MLKKNNYIEQPITQTLETNYMPYAMSVIISRAIPEIDGFKPAHRKLLYTMYKMGLLTGIRTKSTNVIGQTMKLNPHGDASIYETLVRLTRGNASLLHPFIDSKGNFGKQFSRDMAYAASRYTEVKLDEICVEIFKNIEKNSVDFIDNYDGTTKEPILFPTTFPNVLVTNNQGIAVSMASSICSFNLKEICTASIKFIKNPKVDLIKYLKAPDFSTGGEIIYDKEQFKNIYKTGRGSFKLRAKYKYDKENNLIEVYEIPYTTTIEVIIDKVISLVKLNKIKEINDIRNETDKNGLKIAIDIKKNANPDLLMHKLFSMTTLMDSFSCNFNILVEGTPKTMGIKQILEEWLKFRINCIKRQTIFDLEKKQSKYHLLTGLSKIILDIDRAINIIRETEQDDKVIPNLMSGFLIDEKQAEFISEIKLRNINKEYLMKKIDEKTQLEEDIKKLKIICSDEELIKDIICDELENVSKKFGKHRKTDIIYSEDIKEITEEDLIEDYSINLFLTKENYFKKITLISLRSYSEHKLKDNDKIINQVETNNKAETLFFSDKFNLYRIKNYELPECKASSIGQYLPNLFDIDEDENIINMISINKYEGYLLFVFDNGKIAKIKMDAYLTKVNRKKIVNAYNNKDKLVDIKYITKDQDIFLVRDNDKAMLIDTSKISAKATKNAIGVQVFSMKKNSVITKVILNYKDYLENAENYRVNTIPSAGHSLKNDFILND